MYITCPKPNPLTQNPVFLGENVATKHEVKFLSEGIVGEFLIKVCPMYRLARIFWVIKIIKFVSNKLLCFKFSIVLFHMV